MPALNKTPTKKLFIPMTKYDAEKGIAYGVAASSTLDRSNEIFDYEGSKPYFEKWSAAAHAATAGKSQGNLRSMHGGVAAGLIEQISFNDDDELIEVAAKVVDANEQKKCEAGVYTGFSMGGKYVKKWKDGDATRYIADPYEISLVDLPCIPDATFEYVKGAASELRKFHAPEVVKTAAPKAPTNDELADKARELAKAAGDETAWISQLDAARKALTDAPVEVDLEPQHVLKIATTAVDEPTAGGDEDLGAVQKWTHPELPDQTFGKKSELRTALVAKRAEATASALAAPVTEALADLTATLDEKVGKNASDNPDFAGKPDGKGKKPDPKAPAAKPDDKKKAREEADKSKPMKSAADVMARAILVAADPVPSFVERREVIKAARDLDCVAVLPAGFIDAPSDRLEKVATPELAKAATLDSVSSLISLVSSLEGFHSRLCAGDAHYYYSDAITKIDVSPETMTAVSAAVDSLGSIAATLLDEVLSAMKEEDAEKAVGRGRVLGDLQKIGARNSKLDATRLKKAHDLLAEIEPAMCTHGDADKLAPAAELQKQLQANQDAFTKTIGDVLDAVKEIGARVKNIEAQPVEGRPSSVTLRVAEKFAASGTGLDIPDFGGNEARANNERAFVEMTADRSRFDLPRPR